MIAGGLGNVARRARAEARRSRRARRSIVLGGPAMLIGLGGGAASSVASGASQRGSRLRLGAARQRRDGAALPGGDRSLLGARRRAIPIVSIHDVGAGGLSNALPELVHDSRRGARFELREIPSDEPGMSPLRDLVQRGAGALRARDRAGRARASSRRSAQRERCPFAVARHATDDGRLRRRRRRTSANAPDRHAARVLLGKPPRCARRRQRAPRAATPFDARRHRRCARRPLRVLRLPDGRRQDVPDHDRRSHRRRPRRARPDGRAVAGAGGRRAR